MKFFTTLVFLAAIGPLCAQITAIDSFHREVVYLPNLDQLFTLCGTSAEEHTELCRFDPATGELLDRIPLGGLGFRMVASESERFLFLDNPEMGFIDRYNVAADSFDLRIEIPRAGIGGDRSIVSFLPLPGQDSILSVVVTGNGFGTRLLLYQGDEFKSQSSFNLRSSGELHYSGSPNILLFHENFSLGAGNLASILVDSFSTSRVDNYQDFSEDFAGKYARLDNRLFANDGTVLEVDSTGVISKIGTFFDPETDNVSRGFYSDVSVNTDSSQIVRLYTQAFGLSVALRLASFDPSTFETISDIAFPIVGEEIFGYSLVTNFTSLGRTDEYVYLDFEHLKFLRACVGLTDPVPAYDGVTQICNGATTVLTAPQAAREKGEIYWSTGEIGDSIIIDEPGLFYYGILDEAGCYGEIVEPFLVRVAQPVPEPPLIRSIYNSRLCRGGSVTLQVPDFEIEPNVTYEWNNGATGPQITVDSLGSYFAVLIDQNGCRSEPSNPVELVPTDADAPPAPTVVPGGAIDTCAPEVVLQTEEAFHYDWAVDGIISRSEEVTFAVDRENYGDVVNYALVIYNDAGCVSAPTVGQIRFFDTPPVPEITYNPTTRTLGSSVLGPLLWYHQDTLIATTAGRFYEPAFNGFYTARSVGEACDSPLSNLVSVDNLVSSSEPEKVSFNIFPNPASGVMYLSIPSDFQRESLSITVRSTDGRMIYERSTVSGLSQVELPGKEWNAGSYLLFLSTGEKTHVRRIMIVR